MIGNARQIPTVFCTVRLRNDKRRWILNLGWLRIDFLHIQVIKCFVKRDGHFCYMQLRCRQKYVPVKTNGFERHMLVKMQVFMMLRLLRNGIRIPQYNFYHKLNNGFRNIGFIRTSFIVNRFEILGINTQVQQLQSNNQRNKPNNMFFKYLHRTICRKLQPVCFGMVLKKF